MVKLRLGHLYRLKRLADMGNEREGDKGANQDHIIKSGGAVHMP